MKIGIHQPNFIPWLGIFHRIYLVDKFVFFDHVQAMAGRSWLSRNRVLIGGEAKWLTLPVKKSGRSGQLVKNVEINYDVGYIKKHLRTLELNYKKTPFFDLVFSMVKEIYREKYQYIADFNIDFIHRITGLLGLERSFIRSSSLLDEYPILSNLSGNELILGICRSCDAIDYVSGTGCLDFINPQSFEDQGIRFWFQNFDPQKYSQVGTRTFISHLSIIDALCNVGPKNTHDMVSQQSLTRGMNALGDNK